MRHGDKKIREYCVVCGRLTDYHPNTPIQDRVNYIETAGQLCKACAFDVYGKNSR